MECRLPRKKNKDHEANVIDDITQDVSDINLSAMLFEVNLVESNLKEWWIDTGAISMYAQTRSCSLHLNQLMERKFSWETLLLLLWKGKESVDENDIWKRANSKQNVVCARNLQELGLRIVI